MHLIIVLIILSLSSSVMLMDLCELDEYLTIRYYPPKNVSSQNCDCRNNSTCVRKCCKTGYYFDQYDCTAFAQIKDDPVPEDKNYLSFLTYNYKTKVKEVNLTSEYIVGFMQCDYETKGEGFYMQSNGSVYIPNFYREFTNNDLYCVDYDEDYQLYAYLCVPERTIWEKIGAYTNVTGIVISMPFLIILIIVYALLPERNLHMKALMCYAFSLLMAHISLVTIQLFNSFDVETCTYLGYNTVFWFNLTFLWMNVICIDIWYTFRFLTTIDGANKYFDSEIDENDFKSQLYAKHGYAGLSLSQQTKKYYENRRFYYYSAYAIGLSSLMILVVICINVFGDREKWYYPAIGDGLCFVQNNIPLILYYYGPMATTIIANFILFAITAWKILSVEKENKIFKKENSGTHNQDKKKFVLYLKLLLAMGLNWSLDWISWVVMVTVDTNTIPLQVWYIPDFANALYGVFIFFLFVFKRKIYNQLKMRFFPLKGTPNIANRTKTTPGTSMSTLSSSNSSISGTNTSDKNQLNPKQN